MGKLRLKLDQLAVESFDTSAGAGAKGTVFGEQCTCYTNCTCPGCPTCDHTCGQTCGQASCDGSCYSCLWTECDCPSDVYTCNLSLEVFNCCPG